ncbi:MAG: ribonuclease R [Cytophagales bacterium]|nr:ribonuclease R [Cytophagales bacterium]
MSRKKNTFKLSERRNAKRYEKWLLTLLRSDRAYTLRQLYKELKVPNHAKLAVKEAVLALVQAGKLHQLNKGRYVLQKAPTYVVGKVDYVNSSYAYIVTQEGSADIWVKQEDLLGALNKDLVKVMVVQQGGQGKRPIGSVVEIIERSKTLFVGCLKQHGKIAFVVPDGRRMHHDIFIRSADLRGAQDGDKVIVKITGWPTAQKNPTGKVEQVLGKVGIHDVEMHAIMAEFGLPTHFPKKVLAEASAIPTAIPADEINRRRDLRAIPTFTIDPEDAKDFDDALSFRQLSNGYYEVGVHIADVSYYVQEASLLDQEALERGTSVYLVDRTIPMLPEKLANELCSLRPHEDKLTFSAVFELDTQGKVRKEWLGKTVIRSHKRFTYEEAQQIITQQQGDFYEELTALNKLAKQLRAKRFKHGAINFETIEVKFQLDEQGKPLGVVPKVRQDTHKLVEEFMLLANERVATRVYQMKQGKDLLTFVYRTHDSPDPDKLSDFFRFVKHLGYKVGAGHKSIARSLNAISKAVAGKAEENIVQSLAIRTMAKAVYTTEAKRHFGLALQHYTHFTSPIRRYPDVMVHRLLKQYLKGQLNADPQGYEEKCRHASEREGVAAEAERASVQYKRVELVQTLQGTVLEGVISSITDWGIYVELVDNYCEGMVRLADMRDDYYRLDEKHFRIIGKRTKKAYHLGDQVRVQIKSCDLSTRTVSLVFAS